VGGVYASTLKLVIHHRIHHCHVSHFGQINREGLPVR